MFKRSNFCHVASNNRNNVKAGLFVYRTTDDLATVTTSGYFNEMIIDINLHDIIIHEQVNSADNTKVEYNLLCVTEKTLDNIKTAFIKSAFEKEIEQILNEGFVKLDGSSVMTGPLKFSAGSMRGAIAGGLNGVTFFKMDTQGNLSQIGSLSDSQFVPASDNTLDIGTTVRKIERIYLGKVNNGYDIDVPVTNSADTLALKSQVDDAANSGEQLYTTGVWYAKMYSATTVPTGSEYEGRNYADFSQVDGNNDPIIVVYTYNSGAWALTETITPPKNHNGYMTITSKIWDIAEQAGQEGGKVLWSHNQKTFTPYPLIISYANINVTGESTVAMPANPVNAQIVNKQYVDDSLQSVVGVDLFDTKWKDCILKSNNWKKAGATIAKTDAPIAYQHLADEINQWSDAEQFDISKVIDVCFCEITGDSKFVAINSASEGEGARAISMSNDGINWETNYTLPVANPWSPVSSICYGQNKYILMCWNGTLSTSTDGITWTTPTQDTDLASGASNWWKIRYDSTNDRFIALSNSGQISRSADGSTWEDSQSQTSIGESGFVDFAINSGNIVAINNNGYVYLSATGVVSQDANLASVVGLVGENYNYWQSIAFDGTQYIALSDCGYISTSTDGTNWSVPVLEDKLYANWGNDSWTQLAFGNNAFVAIAGYTGKISLLFEKSTETIAGTSIEYYLTADGHKIVLPDQATALNTIYANTGIAWYYMVDTTAETFMLPRSKWNFVGTRDTVGGYVEPGLPDLTLEFDADSSDGYDTLGGMMTSKTEQQHYGLDGGNRTMGVYRYSGNAGNANSIYGNSTSVQSPATQMYLYFYVK